MDDFQKRFREDQIRREQERNEDRRHRERMALERKRDRIASKRVQGLSEPAIRKSERNRGCVPALVIIAGLLFFFLLSSLSSARFDAQSDSAPRARDVNYETPSEIGSANDNPVEEVASGKSDDIEGAGAAVPDGNLENIGREDSEIQFITKPVVQDISKYSTDSDMTSAKPDS